MIHYSISYNNPHRHLVDFELSTTTNGANKMLFQLAAWRPGRYELGNFSQNIINWQVFDENQNQLFFKKITKDLWEVKTSKIKQINIVYSFYSNQLDAGSCYLDEHQLYLNPVHCMFYIEGRMNEKYQIKFNIPKNYKIATSMKRDGDILSVKSYDLLAESPIICSKSIQHECYYVDNIPFHLWFQGECNINWRKLKEDFTSFTKSQIKHFGKFPVNEYHFLFQITPYKSYHGVEHTKNTVILLGPGQDLMTKRYEDLLGVCSHELYHTWNIKAIRPVEMYPYDYTKENYFKTGFVAEGVTTYMGDLMLYNSGVFNWSEFIKTQNQNLERHLTNYGRFNLSVADSGFDNWLDGYKLGAPNRKVSIYPDGALCMLMIDLEIIKNTNGKKSLHSVMKKLYMDYALKEKGYSEDDFKKICLDFGGLSVLKIFENHIYGTKDYIPTIKKSLSVIGMKLKMKKNPNLLAQYLGIIGVIENGNIVIKKVEPNSIADKNHIAPEDLIILINGKKINKNVSKQLKSSNENITLKIKKKFSTKDIKIKTGNYYKLLEIVKKQNATKKQLLLRKIWAS